MPLTPAVRDVWTKHPGYQLAWGINVLMALYYGGTAMTMPARFGAVTYDGLRYSLGITTWGAVLAAYGLLLLVCIWAPGRLLMAVFVAGSLFYTLLAVWFAMGLGDPRASPWGPGFLFLGMWQLTQWVAYRQAVRTLAAQAPGPPE